MLIRVTIDHRRASILPAIKDMGAALLVSANSLWDNSRGEFHNRWQVFRGFDLALDSGGFVAMKRYGRYRWQPRQYVALAGKMAPAWWAQMDFCCEPEIAADAAAVRSRINSTVDGLRECSRIADGEGVPAPMPVLQGWKPEDYCRGPIYEEAFPWPDLVGVGSVCRRPMHGKTGLLAVLEALHAAVPPGVRFHLFGVKGAAARKVQELYPSRAHSMDSAAWNMEARWRAFHTGQPCNNSLRLQCLREWYEQHTEQPAQLTFGL